MGSGAAGRPPPRGPPPNFEAFGCSDDGFKVTGQLLKQGFSTAVPQMGYDEGLFSYVGCRCNDGYDNIYSIDSTGLFLGKSLSPASVGIRVHLCMIPAKHCCLNLEHKVLNMASATEAFPDQVSMFSSV